MDVSLGQSELGVGNLALELLVESPTVRLYIACDDHFLSLESQRQVGALKGVVTLALGLAACSVGNGEEIRVAVASNFAQPMREIADRFERHTGHEVVLSTASTGKHYAQIVNGAPFDVFFAADTERPKLLEQALAVDGSRFTYARGALVLWSPVAGLVDADGGVLGENRFRFLAIANPELAPYGRAAKEVLERRGLWQSLQDRLVRGENIGQAYQFVASGNAELGFVARSQIEQAGRSVGGSWWEIPEELYSPIEQQAILIRESPLARQFLAFMRQDEVVEILRIYGYENP